MTGIVTDLGLLLGHVLRGHDPEWPRMRLLAFLFSGFLVGGVLAAWAYPALGDLSLLPAAFALGLAATVFWWFAHRSGPIPH
jgi:uncharacterized membrane protein YoaK (UPF0700 family)